MVFTSAQTIPVLFQLASSGGNKTLSSTYTSSVGSCHTQTHQFCKNLKISQNGFRLGFLGHLKGHIAQSEMESVVSHYQVT